MNFTKSIAFGRWISMISFDNFFSFCLYFMKKILWWCLALLCVVPMVSNWYEPTIDDKEWLHEVEERIEDMVPMKAQGLVKAYDLLDQKRMSLLLAWGKRGLYLVEALKKILAKELFEQSDICFDTHAQFGDTVEIMYEVQRADNLVLRKSKQALAFNVWSEVIWKSLSRWVTGLSEGETKKRTLTSVWIKEKDTDNTMKSFNKNVVESTSDLLLVWEEYAFGTPELDAVVLWTISQITEDMVVFDFQNAWLGREVTMYATLESLIKWCN